MDDRLHQIEAREKAASPGPWTTPETEEYVEGFIVAVREDGHYEPSHDRRHFLADSAFIANARADVPWLVGALRELGTYVQHSPACILSISKSPIAKADWCDCGLTEVLAGVSAGPQPDLGSAKASVSEHDASTTEVDDG